MGAPVSHLCSKVAKGVGILGRLRHILPQNVLRTIYLTLIYPHLTYCSTVWSSASSSLIKRLVTLQKRAVRHITCSRSRDHTGNLFKSLNLLKLHDVINLNTITFTYKLTHNLLSTQFSDFYTHNYLVHGYNTRQSGHLHIPTISSSSNKNSFRYRAVRLWNTIPSQLKSKPNLISFRRNFSRYVINDY